MQAMTNNLTQEQILTHIQCVYQSEPEWDAAREVLLAVGGRAVPDLIATLAAELAPDPGLRLAKLLIQMGDPQALLALLVSSRRSRPIYPFVGTLLDKMTKRGSSQDIQILMDVLGRAHPRWVGSAFLAEISSYEAVQSATALVRIAERDPKPELRAAVPLLNFHLFSPVEFIALRKRLKRALGEGTLPIPAFAENKTDSLPLPTQPEDNAAP